VFRLRVKQSSFLPLRVSRPFTPDMDNAIVGTLYRMLCKAYIQARTVTPGFCFMEERI
jgi:hypothetical protein